MRFNNPKDACTGLLYLLSGLFFSLSSTRYPIGTLTAMEAGYFPLALGLLLAGIGAIILVRSTFWRVVEAGRLSAFKPRIAISILASIMAFPLLLQQVGLLLVCFLMFVLASLALPSVRWRSTVAAAVIVSVASGLLFVSLLHLRIPLLPRG